jgi:hypothetical protein
MWTQEKASLANVLTSSESKLGAFMTLNERALNVDRHVVLEAMELSMETRPVEEYNRCTICCRVEDSLCEQLASENSSRNSAIVGRQGSS